MINPLKPKHLAKIATLDVGVVTLNLEDAIAKERKAEALQNIIDFLRQNIDVKPKIVVRVNTLREGGKTEIEAFDMR